MVRPPFEKQMHGQYDQQHGCRREQPLQIAAAALFCPHPALPPFRLPLRNALPRTGDVPEEARFRHFSPLYLFAPAFSTAEPRRREGRTVYRNSLTPFASRTMSVLTALSMDRERSSPPCPSRENS